MELLEAIGESTTLYEEVIKDALTKRILIFNDVVDAAVVENYIYYIIKWNTEDADKPSDKRQPIRMLINSPGGDLTSCMGLIDVIIASKTPVWAFGVGEVASAAYYIYIACDRRFAFVNTIFLQHDGQLEVQNSSGKVKDTMNFIDRLDERIKNYVISKTNITSEDYDKMYEKEIFMFADDAKERGIVDQIIGIDIDFDIFNGVV